MHGLIEPEAGELIEPHRGINAGEAAVKRNQHGIPPHRHNQVHENSQFLEAEKKDGLRVPIAEPANRRGNSRARQIAAIEPIGDVHDDKNCGEHAEVRGDMQGSVRQIRMEQKHQGAAEAQIEKRDPFKRAAGFEDVARERTHTSARAGDEPADACGSAVVAG